MRATNRQTNKQTDTLIAVFRPPVGDEVIIEVGWKTSSIGYRCTRWRSAAFTVGFALQRDVD